MEQPPVNPVSDDDDDLDNVTQLRPQFRPDGTPADVGERTDRVEPRGDLEAVAEVARAHDELVAEIEKRIIGQRKVIEQLLIALFARGHCLFVGVPGLAKTLLISTLAEALNLRFSRIQFTPDLMPADITGTEVLEEDHATGRRAFRFIGGPVFANLVLADEINRTPPKTQAALLQSMQEYRVTAGGHTHELPLPFLVFATQNPIEQEGTYPLPEAQLDRFMFQVDVDYPRRRTSSACRPRATRPAWSGCCRRAGSSSCRTWCGGCRPPITWSATRWRWPAPPAPRRRARPGSSRSTCSGAPGRAPRSS